MIYGKPVFFTTLRPTLEGAWIPALAMVLECACGTGAISMFVAPVCARLMATDFSNGMLKQTAKKAKRFTNIEVAYADITKLDFPDNCFDKVIAGNVIHLLDNPQAAVMELVRVCKPEGKVIIPTYINKKDGKTGKMAALLGKADAGFKRQTESLSRRRGCVL
jgi:ubiquinone/menaquinone biosynthesis C-methylase UbiE